MTPSKPSALRRALKWALVRLGIIQRIQDGRIILDPSVVVPNFLFQRIFGVNRKCKWSIHFTSTAITPERIEIGQGVRRSFAVSGGCYFQALNGIAIGDGTIFAPGVKIISANHDSTNLAKHMRCSPIVIGRNCWLGTNAIILPGVSLGDNVVVGAGAVVTRSFPAGSVIVGNPARLLTPSTDAVRT